MASINDRLHWNRSKKIVTLITLVILILLCSGFVLASQIKTVYQVSYNGTTIGEASSPEIVKQWFQNEYAKFSSEFPDINFETNENDFTIVETKRLNAKAVDEAVIDSLQKSFIVEGRGIQVVINGQAMGIVKDQETADRILDGLQQSVAPAKKDLKIQALSYNGEEKQDKNDISSPPTLKSIGFVEKVKLESIVSDPTDFVSEADLVKRLKGTDLKPITYVVKDGDCVSCIAQKFNISQEAIYTNNPWIINDFINIGDELDLTVRQPKLSVKTEEEYSETVSISGGVEITYDKTMRVGVSKVTNPGKAGKKKITYLTTKVNGELVEEKVIKEETLDKAIPKKVTQGSKVIKGVGTGAFSWPITGPTITSEFGKRWGRLHAGTDTVSSNRDIYASDNGKVITADYNSSFGNHVIIDHRNGYKTVYAHLSKIKVKKGDLLEKGDLLGIMGTTGRSTGVHLHFEIRKGNTQLNPLKFLN
ncbi:MAG: LysM peptidoglycan-binding domain-containing M23 family metallopeptidase [Candidatus Pristimantibacillus sp.]